MLGRGTQRSGLAGERCPLVGSKHSCGAPALQPARAGGKRRLRRRGLKGRRDLCGNWLPLPLDCRQSPVGETPGVPRCVTVMWNRDMCHVEPRAPHPEAFPQPTPGIPGPAFRVVLPLPAEASLKMQSEDGREAGSRLLTAGREAGEGKGSRLRFRGTGWWGLPPTTLAARRKGAEGAHSAGLCLGCGLAVFACWSPPVSLCPSGRLSPTPPQQGPRGAPGAGKPLSCDLSGSRTLEPEGASWLPSRLSAYLPLKETEARLIFNPFQIYLHFIRNCLQLCLMQRNKADGESCDAHRETFSVF